MSRNGDSPGRIERWLIPVLIVGFCVVAFWLSTTFKKMPPILKRGIQPSDFPQLLLASIALLAMLMAWVDPIRIREKFHRNTLGTLVLFGVFALVTTIDFFLALAAFAGALSVLWGERRAWVIALIGVGVPASIFFLFDQVFEIRFPRGLLTNLWYG